MRNNIPNKYQKPTLTNIGCTKGAQASLINTDTFSSKFIASNGFAIGRSVDQNLSQNQSPRFESYMLGTALDYHKGPDICLSQIQSLVGLQKGRKLTKL